MPRLEAFRQSHPDIQINLSCSYESLHFSRDQIDVDIRHGHPNWPSYEVRTVRNEKVALLASPKLLAQRPIKRAADLLDSDLICPKPLCSNGRNGLPSMVWHARKNLSR
jgi:DNA-binding transcriptional LysR family regulator